MLIIMILVIPMMTIFIVVIIIVNISIMSCFTLPVQLSPQRFDRPGAASPREIYSTRK